MAEGGGTDIRKDIKKSNYHIEPDSNYGFIGDIDDYRTLFEKIYKAKNNPLIPYSHIVHLIDILVKCAIIKYWNV